MRNNTRVKLTVAAGMVACVGIGTTVGVATAATTPKVFYACQNKTSGVLRLLNTGGKCNTTTENAVQWNQVGPIGPAGAKGATGVAGPKGATGAAGVAGAKGATGATGVAGAPGPQGPAGPAGTSSVTGFAGGTVQFSQKDVLVQVASRTVPAGSYAVVANANITQFGKFDGDAVVSSYCEIRNNGGYMNGASARISIPDSDTGGTSLGMNGGAYDTSTGTISLWCRSQDGAGTVTGQIMITSIGGFF